MSDNMTPKEKKVNHQRRWYDTSYIKKFVDSFETAPPFKRDAIANKILDVIESVFKNEINKKVNTNKYMILGMYKEYEKRRWYDRNPTILKSIKAMCTTVNQRRDLQKMACAGVVDALGEYYIKDEPKIEIRTPVIEPEPIIEEPVFETEEIVEEEIDETVPRKKPDSKVMVSGEKLFIKRDKKPLKPKPKI